MITTINSVPVSVHFVWDMNATEFAHLHRTSENAEFCEGCYDYLGALFFGNFKLEFIQNETTEGYRNLFVLGRDGYGYLEDGTPYGEMLDAGSEIVVPYRRTFDAFARDVERQIADMLSRYPGMIPDATVPTEPTRWYPKDDDYQTCLEFSREA